MKIKPCRVLAVLLLCGSTIVVCGCGRKFSYPPVTVTFRESLINSGRVMQVTNRSAQETIMALVQGRDKSNGNNKIEWVLKIAPGDTKEVGVWQTLINFEKGDKYKVSCEGYWGVLNGVVP